MATRQVAFRRSLTPTPVKPKPIRRPRRPGWRPPPLWTPCRKLWTPQNAATLDASIGSKNQAASTTCSLVTSAAAAAGSLIVIGVGYFATGGSGVTVSVTTTGGLTWNAGTRTNTGSISGYLFYAYAPSGLASGTTLTWTTSSNNADWIMAGASFLGMESTPTLLSSNGAAATAAAWSSGSIAAGETNLGVVMAFQDGTSPPTSTSTAPLTELYDIQVAGQTESFTFAYDLASAATATLAGSWSASCTHVARGSAFQIAAGTAPAATGFIPHRMPLGV